MPAPTPEDSSAAFVMSRLQGATTEQAALDAVYEVLCKLTGKPHTEGRTVIFQTADGLIGLARTGAGSDGSPPIALVTEFKKVDYDGARGIFRRTYRCDPIRTPRTVWLFREQGEEVTTTWDTR